jgi:hypothetical protein
MTPTVNHHIPPIFKLSHSFEPPLQKKYEATTSHQRQEYKECFKINPMRRNVGESAKLGKTIKKLFKR